MLGGGTPDTNLPSKEETFEYFSPESQGLDCLSCAIFAGLDTLGHVPTPSETILGGGSLCLQNSSSQGQNLALTVLFVPNSLAARPKAF